MASSPQNHHLSMTMTMLLLFLLFLKMTTRFGAKRARTGEYIFGVVFALLFWLFGGGYISSSSSSQRTNDDKTHGKPTPFGRSIDDDARKFPSLSPSLLLLRKRGFGWCEKENRFKALLLLLLLLIIVAGDGVVFLFSPTTTPDKNIS